MFRREWIPGYLKNIPESIEHRTLYKEDGRLEDSMTTIADILKPEELNAITSSKEDIAWLNSQIKTKSNGKPGVECIVRGKNTESDDGLFELKPEEVVRQLQAKYLIDKCGYKKEQLNFEVPVITHGRSRTYDSRVDIAVMDLNKPSKYDIIIEVKRPEVTDVYKENDNDQNSPFEQMKDIATKNTQKLAV